MISPQIAALEPLWQWLDRDTPGHQQDAVTAETWPPWQPAGVPSRDNLQAQVYHRTGHQRQQNHDPP